MEEPMFDEPDGPPPVRALSYAPPPPPRPSMLAAVVLSAPGAVCWLALGCIILAITSPGFAERSQWVIRWLGGLGVFLKLLVCWGIAIIAALVSLVLYTGLRPKPWYVRVNLTINVAGLVFTVGVFALVGCVRMLR